MSTKKHKPIEVIIFEKDNSNMVSSWTDRIVLSQRKDGTFRVRWYKLSVDFDNGTQTVIKYDRIKTGEQFVEAVKKIDGDLGDCGIEWQFVIEEISKINPEFATKVRKAAAGYLADEEDDQTLRSMSSLADTYRNQGDFAGARRLQEKVLEARRHIQREDHPDTLLSMSHLALTLEDQEDLAGTRRLQEQVLEARRRIQGEDHADTLTAMNDLAFTVREQGDFAGARRLFEQEFQARRRIQGEDNPDTLLSMSHLAGTLAKEGDLAGARRLQEQVLKARRRIHGEDHPDTLTAMLSIAGTLHEQGDLAGARRLYEHGDSLQGRGDSLQDTINQIVEGFLSGDRNKNGQAAELYRGTFNLDEIQSEAVRCGTMAPNWFLEFDRDHLELLEESFSPERMQELESGAEPTPEERESYRTHRLSQVENGDCDWEWIPGFWIHQIRDSNGNELFALTTVTGYAFSGIHTEFHGFFLSEKDCIEYLKMCGVVAGC